MIDLCLSENLWLKYVFLIHDSNKEIDISYNHLNPPEWLILVIVLLRSMLWNIFNDWKEKNYEKRGKMESRLAVFQGKKLRKVFWEKEWWFSVVDIIEILTDSTNPRDYWYRLKTRVRGESEIELSTNCRQLKMKATDGKMRFTDCANTEHVFRIIQSIPSPKAEPFKRWLAKVGYERVEEIENPELAQERMKELYEKKGYSKDWIDKRVRGIAVRQGLTDEWKERGILEKRDYAILTAEISRATFGMTPSEYKNYKGIPKTSKANLRDNMTDLELIFTMLGERVTTEISQNEEPQSMNENKVVAKRGGRVAGNARKETEKELGKSIISKDNFLSIDTHAEKTEIENLDE